MEKKEKLYKNWSIRELEDNLKDVINSLTKEDLLIYITDTMVFAEEHIAELDKAREEGYEQCKKDFISNFCDVADRPLIISKTVVKDMFAQLKDGVNLWEDKLKDNK